MTECASPAQIAATALNLVDGCRSTMDCADCALLLFHQEAIAHEQG
jgi:hypothetical protein